MIQMMKLRLRPRKLRFAGFDHGEGKILTDEILGWLVLWKSGLPANARLSVLSAINNSLGLDMMERAMRDQEDGESDERSGGRTRRG